jgi:polyhydroxyalkanoic acid synthase PhaR subunit
MTQTNGNTADAASGDVMQLWRSWLTETERQWNSFFGEVLGTESFARFSGNYADAYSVIQRALNQGMERYLNTFNLPTHSDIVELGERLHNIEERLASLEANINSLVQAAGVTPGAPVTPIRPRRTRRPRTQSGGSK